MTDSVATPNGEYELMRPLWTMTSTLRGGTSAMRAAGSVYLPQEPAEPAEAYEIRKKRSVLTNYYDKSVRKLSGKPFRQPVQTENLPDDLQPLMSNITNAGQNLDVFSRQWLEAAIDGGVAHVLVDQPPTTNIAGEVNGSLSVRQVRENNIRPYAKIIRVSDLIGWKSEIQGGQQVLTQIRIKECVKVPDPEDEFSDIEVERVRVVEPFIQRVYEKEAATDSTPEAWVLIEAYPTPFDFIPLVTLYTDQKGFLTAEPWLQDLAYLNVCHWQSDSDQRNILHVARVPILFGTGFGDEDDGSSVKMTVGVSAFTRAPKGATLEYVEHTGQGITAGANDLTDLEERMQMMAFETVLRQQPTGDVTATGDILDQMEIDSELGALARAEEDALEKVLSYMAKWQGTDDDMDGKVKIFKDFGLSSQDSSAVSSLLAMRANGDLSRVGLITELKRRGLLADSFDANADLDLLDLEGPSLDERQMNLDEHATEEDLALRKKQLEETAANNKRNANKPRPAPGAPR